MLVEQLEPKTLCTTNINLKNSTSFNYFFNNLESRIRKKKKGRGGGEYHSKSITLSMAFSPRVSSKVSYQKNWVVGGKSGGLNPIS